MDKKILITYAAFNRSPAAAADVISLVIKEHGLLVDIIPVRSSPDIGQYSAVIIGGNVRLGQVHADMSAFIHNYRSELSHIPVACFVINNTLTAPSEDTRQVLIKALDHVCSQVDSLKPVSIAVFIRQTNILEFLIPGKSRANQVIRKSGLEMIQVWTESLIPKLVD